MEVAMTGLTLGEYIRNRRLSLAAGDLLSTEDKIITIAFKYGYQTAEGFTKAFKRQFGYSPSSVRIWTWMRGCLIMAS